MLKSTTGCTRTVTFTAILNERGIPHCQIFCVRLFSIPRKIYCQIKNLLNNMIIKILSICPTNNVNYDFSHIFISESNGYVPLLRII